MTRLLYPGRIATFREQGAKDKAPRKKKTLLGAIGKGALIGAAIPTIGLAATGGAFGLMAGKGIRGKIMSGLNGAAVLPAGTLAGLNLVSTPATAAIGGGIGAAAYGINKLRNKKSTQETQATPPKKTFRSYLPKPGGN